MALPATILVAIASWGTKNDQYLLQLLTEYRSMSLDVKVVVLSNIHKEVPPEVEVVVVDLKGDNPWSLPFAHKEIFASRLNDYDLFVYSEDDTLITERNLHAFREISAVLPEGEIPGFLRFERGPDGERNFPDVHAHFHWDPGSVRSRAKYTLAFFTNEHSACYVLTRQQLRSAIDSGGFLVRPHSSGKYLLLETASTDPYTQCGFTKLICISQMEDFLVHHLPNKYVGTALGVGGSELQRQVNVLLQIGKNGSVSTSLFPTETKLRHAYYSKSYYEDVRPEIVSAIPIDARSVLSIGCGRGAMEVSLAKKGLRVVAIPLDAVISAGAQAEGVEVVEGDFHAALDKLAGESFDCLLLSNVLHLVPDPIDVLVSVRNVLADGGAAVLLVPHVLRLLLRWRQTPHNGRFENRTRYEETGVHVTSHKIVRGWLRSAGMRLEDITDVLSPRAQAVGRLALGLTDTFLSSEFIVVAKRA
jgi:SAM-dependent methyltransferase